MINSSASASAMTPSTRRPIPLEMRLDLVIKRIDYGGVGYWVVKDPAGLKYYRLQQEQYEVLRLMNGNRSLEEIREGMLQVMPTVRLQLSDIQHLITDLHEKGLVYSNRMGQGAALLKKQFEEKKKKFFNTLKSLLYLRLPGWDPHKTLEAIHPFLKWMFTPFGVGLYLFVVCSSWLLLATQFDTFSQQLPTFQSFFGWPNLLWLWASLGVCKIIHEFGHGLSCKHFGGECHEMGVMLLVFSPCLYCDVSDSWMLKNKWHRIMIGAAGMYIEVLISAFAIFIWWYTRQGLLHNLAMNVFFVTTISTVIFNANPLMRFDGYYMMSDFLEIPNLRPKADKLMREYFAWYCLGIESKPDPFMPETGRGWFITFAVVASIYRIFIVFAITIFLYTVLKPYGLQSIGATMAVFSLATIVGSMAYNLYQIITTPRIEPMSRPKIIFSLTLLFTVLVVGLMVKIPWHLEATFIVEPHDVYHVYTKTAGELAEMRVKPGDIVKKGDVVAVLDNPEKKDQLRNLQTQLAVQEAERDMRVVLKDAPQKFVAEKRIASLEKQIAEIERQIADLTIVASADGKVVEAPRVSEPPIEQKRTQLGKWHGTPLDVRNLGAVLDERTHLLSIAPNDNYQAIVLIDQGDRAELEREGIDLTDRLEASEKAHQAMEIKFEHMADRTYESRIVEFSKQALDYIPEQLSSKVGGELATVTDSQGREKLVSSVYQATLDIDQDTDMLRSGMRGRARFLVDKRTAGAWIWRYIRRTFFFRL